MINRSLNRTKNKVNIIFLFVKLFVYTYILYDFKRSLRKPKT